MDKESVEMRYLLGKLSNSEAAHLEEGSFVDDGVFDEIEAAEDELVDAYVRGSLSSEDRKRFDEKLLRSKRLAERVEFSKLFSKLAVPSPSVSREPVKAGWWKNLFDFLFLQNAAIRAAVVAAVFLLVVGSPATFVVMRLRDERRLNDERLAIEQQKRELDRRLSEQLSATNQQTVNLQNLKAEEDRLQQEIQARKEELAETTAQSTAPASILLFPGAIRGSEGRILTVPSTASTVRLRLVVESDDYGTYEATLQTSDGRTVVTRPNLKPTPSGKVRIIVLQVRSQLLSSGDYEVNLRGRTQSGPYEPVAEYAVRLIKK